MLCDNDSIMMKGALFDPNPVILEKKEKNPLKSTHFGITHWLFSETKERYNGKKHYVTADIRHSYFYNGLSMHEKTWTIWVYIPLDNQAWGGGGDCPPIQLMHNSEAPLECRARPWVYLRGACVNRHLEPCNWLASFESNFLEISWK